VTEILPNGNFIIEWPGNVEIHFTKKFWMNNYYANRSHPISWLDAPNCKFEVDADGVLMDPRELVLSGYVARERVARSLPHDFRPDFKDLILLAEVDSSQLGQNKWNNYREKPYLGLNKPYFSPGETVWFSSRMLYQNPVFEDSLSRLLYVDLLNDRNEAVLMETFPIVSGLAQGQLQLPAGIPAGDYAIRAYTNWMRNFSDEDFFYKAVQIIPVDREVVSFADFSATSQDEENEVSPTAKIAWIQKDLFNQAVIDISLLDADSSFLQGDFSISLIDAGVATFLAEDKSIVEAMEWLGKEMEDVVFPSGPFNIEYGISLSGVFSDRKNKPLAVPLTVVQGQIEDYGIIKSDSSGNFWVSGLSFTDSVDIAIAALNQKRKSFGNVALKEFQRPKSTNIIQSLNLTTRPKSLSGGIDDFKLEGDYFELEEFTLEAEKKKTMAEINYGYGEGDRSIGQKFLEQFPEKTVAEIIGMQMPMGIMGTKNWGLKTGEPLLILDGSPYILGSWESTFGILSEWLASEVESIEVFNYNATKFGMAGFAGVIMVKSKKGAGSNKDEGVFNSDQFQLFKVKGFSPVREFPVHKSDTEIPESRPTIYWNPNAATNSESGTFSFSVNIPITTKNMLMKVEGISNDGLPFYRIFQIPVIGH
jgi:hypothetical protein